MLYHSTRGGENSVQASQAILQGLAGDGGLFVPEDFPAFSPEALQRIPELPYHVLAEEILTPWLTDMRREDIARMAVQAYAPGRFEAGMPAPGSALDGKTFLVELYHGPTLAFKDIALQLLPRLMVNAIRTQRVDEGVLVVAATSGDTGKAALEGFCDVEGTRVGVIYPQDGVSPAQRRQMVTQQGGNVWVRAIRGNFDDAQSAVKAIMGDPAMHMALRERGWRLSSANSINIGRLIPQIVYYFYAYGQLCRQGILAFGEPVDFVVPTGNFGNILAGTYAKAMGLPVHTFLCASNRNNVLTDFFRTGSYSTRRPFYQTASPSMDILISSNLERYLYEKAGRDPKRVAGWMQALREERVYDVGGCLDAMTQGMWAGCADDAATLACIARTFREKGRLVDPHTAVALSVLEQYRQEARDGGRPAVVISTASPYKFSLDVLKAVDPGRRCEDDREASRILAGMAQESLPDAITALDTLPELHTCACEPGEVGGELLRWIGGGHAD